MLSLWVEGHGLGSCCSVTTSSSLLVKLNETSGYGSSMLIVGLKEIHLATLPLFLVSLFLPPLPPFALHSLYVSPTLSPLHPPCSLYLHPPEAIVPT